MGKKGGIRLRWPGSREAQREHEVALAAHPPQPKATKKPGKAKRKSKKGRQGAAISREDLRALHARVKTICGEGGHGPGTEAFSLMCQAGAAMGKWPRVRRETVETMRRRLADLTGAKVSEAPAEYRGLPCCRCEQETPADELTCLYGGYWVCRRCRGAHAALARQDGRRVRGCFQGD